MNLRAFRICWGGIVAHYAATSAGRAKIMAARDIEDAFGGTVGEALKTMSCRREPEKDVDALCVGKEAGIPCRIEW